MEKEYTFVIKSKLTSEIKFIIAVDRYDAINKALIKFDNHIWHNFTILKKL